ncbi:MAG TPA: hypothetical protein PKV30_10525 [Ottowia sp.]|nr:hypothetical protein [Ottowia sp.]
MRWMLLIVAVVAGFYGWKHTGERAVAREVAHVAVRNPSGFVPVAMPADAPARTVWVFAPQNCPSDAAARADNLARTLQAEGIPVVRASSLSIQITAPDEETKQRLQRLDVVMRGTIPAVLIDGMGKANPSAEEVIREFRRTGG